MIFTKVLKFKSAVVVAIITMIVISCSTTKSLKNTPIGLINNVSYQDSSFDNSNASNGFLVGHKDNTYAVTAKHVLMIAKTDAMKFVDFEGGLKSSSESESFFTTSGFFGRIFISPVGRANGASSSPSSSPEDSSLSAKIAAFFLRFWICVFSVRICCFLTSSSSKLSALVTSYFFSYNIGSVFFSVVFNEDFLAHLYSSSLSSDDSYELESESCFLPLIY